MLELLATLEKEISRRGLDNDKISSILSENKDVVNRRIIQGYASVSVVDREGQKIPIYALKEAVHRFMLNPFYRPLTVFHSDIVVGRILPKWTNPDNGETLMSEVDNLGWKVLAEIRDDIDVANKTWDEVVKGNLRSFSIAGSSKDKLQINSNGNNYEEIKSLDIYENTICQMGVNQEAKFNILWNPQSIRF